jgi:hypothetical protein
MTSALDGDGLLDVYSSLFLHAKYNPKTDLNVCDGGINTVIEFFYIIHCPVFCLK